MSPIPASAILVADALFAVRAIHQKRTSPIADFPADHTYCSECRQTWPCATIAALDDLELRIALDVGQEAF